MLIVQSPLEEPILHLKGVIRKGLDFMNLFRGERSRTYVYQWNPFFLFAIRERMLQYSVPFAVSITLLLTRFLVYSVNRKVQALLGSYLDGVSPSQ